MHAGGGASLAAVVRRASDAGLAGIEFGCAIPGTIGGGVRMNAGAYGGEFKQVLAFATVVSITGVRSVDASSLGLRYRHSNLRSGEVVASAVLQLCSDEPAAIKRRVRELQARRAAGQPRKVRTFGSVFKNPDSGPGSGALIESCGLKGHAIGGARISPVHANFIENVDGAASSADVAALIRLARDTVRERHGVELRHEVELLGEIAL